VAADLCSLTAVSLARMLRRGEVSAVEVLEAHLARIEAVNPDVNAIVTLVPERAWETARRADEALARGDAIGSLHGLPVAHKDLALTAGIRTTFGSPIYADFVPDEDELFVQRVAAAGAVVVGKTNTPEFGAGSQTFNPVFGPTRNPHDLTRTVGGSSGGAAAALAAGMVPIADGSDLGGSLRNPASFCGVVGFRPSPGRVPSWPSRDPWGSLSVDGPMARTVEDTALLLSVMAGPDRRVPISLPEAGSTLAPPLDAELGAPRVAWAPTAGGTMPFEPEVSATVDAARPLFEAVGCRTKDAFPDLTGARDVFLTFRAHIFAQAVADVVPRERERIKPSLRWNVEAGLALTGAEIGRAERLRGEIHARVVEFFDRFDALVLPTVQVAPFPVEVEYPMDVAGVPMETYVDWMQSCWCISVTSCPAISVPCGTTADGLPVGLQIVGRPRGDLELLRLAHAFEQARG
jgi:amidase